jgi:hypothetical protein
MTLVVADEFFSPRFWVIEISSRDLRRVNFVFEDHKPLKVITNATKFFFFLQISKRLEVVIYPLPYLVLFLYTS